MLARFLLVIFVAVLCLGPVAAAEQPATPPTQTDQATAPVQGPSGSEGPVQPEMSREDKRDADIGKSASEELEKQHKVTADSPDLPRLTAIVEAIRPITQKPHQAYQVKVLADKGINALSLPGGYLYFTQGLLDAVESDDELAAVAGHEMAHICLSHSRKMMSRDKRYSTILGSVLLASILSGSESVNPGAVATVGSMVAQDALNHYGQAAEQEADQQAVLYLKASGKYNPVAVLTVVEGLARIEGSEGNPELGIEKTHPYGRERVEAVSQELEKLGIPLDRRRVTHSLVAEAVVVSKNDREIGELRMNAGEAVLPKPSGAAPEAAQERSSRLVVYQPAVAVGDISAVARAKQSADLLNELLLENLQVLEVSTAEHDGSVDLVARGQVFATITPGDAEFHQTEVKALAGKAIEAIRLGFSEERVRRAY